MTYMYDGFRIIAKGLRGLDRHVAVMGALCVPLSRIQGNRNV